MAVCESIRPSEPQSAITAPPTPFRAQRLWPIPVFLVVTVALFLSHLPFLRLPYYWDEAGQFVPAARDILTFGDWVPVSTVPNIHPPAVMAYLALVWRIAGYTPAATRTAMLLLAALGLLATFFLAAELRAPPRYTVLLLFVSPLFFAQAMLAQLDAPAMVFTALALTYFLRNRIRIAVCCCVVLVLVKETGLMVVLVLATSLAWERRWRDATWFALPCLALFVWIATVTDRTGHWGGNAEYVRYNLFYPLNPFRVALSLIRRAYYLSIADGHWIGTSAIIYGWRKTDCFRRRSWRIVGRLVSAHAIMLVLVGGAGLERYLLPIMPVVYSAMAAGIRLLPAPARAFSATFLVAGLAAGNWFNPPHPFPYEDNLAFVDFINLQEQVAHYLSRYYPNERIHTAWPLTSELSRPELSFVSRAFPVAAIPDFSPPLLRTLDWRQVQVLVTFSSAWDPSVNLMHFGPLRAIWERYCGALPATRQEVSRMVPFARVAHFERSGQWLDIFVNSLPIPIDRRLAARDVHK